MPRVAIIGTGGVATRHAEALAEIGGADLIQDVLDDPATDAVLVLSNTDTHVDYATRAWKT